MDKKTIKIEQLVDGKKIVREHELKLEYRCECEPCDCYLIPEEREYCSPDCRCYEPEPEYKCDCAKS